MNNPITNPITVEIGSEYEMDVSQFDVSKKAAKALNDAVSTLGAYGIVSDVECANLLTRCQNRVNVRPVDKSKSLSEE